jgi:hypothetical protein
MSRCARDIIISGLLFISAISICGAILLFKDFLNSNSIIRSDESPTLNVGKAIWIKYSEKVMPKALDMYMLVGFPIRNKRLHVFAATNSIMRYGMGFIFADLQK